MGFNSWKDFENFEKNVKFKNRYMHTDEVKEFLFNIKKSLPAREKVLPKGTVLYRAQIGYDETEIEGQVVICGFSKERMKPLAYKGQEGRANPKGISYLYLSNDENTAMAELRPHTGEYISSAQFKINRNLKIVDCYSVPKHYNYFGCIFDPPTSQEEIGYAIWSMINEAFTKPTKNNDSSSDYVPTQILAELFKADGFDGICFKSSLGIGYNVVLFGLDMANIINCTVMETTSVIYNFSECGNRYYVKEQQTV